MEERKSDRAAHQLYLARTDVQAAVRKRWELLNAMTDAGAMSIREAALRVERDVKAVHGDVTALLNAGLLSKTDDGMIVFPYDAIHVGFMLKAA